ncbi:MATE family efflux transporter [Paenibacillus bovis]|uniref:MATE family efflux transporter n=1 Tax=Paenibacillus bovis TaxID=1616788 RepID=A0A172ZB31_9BACL|nr:MATE family efflux transporter [Paenibacillus bovis]ANF94703.1 MATE family efflux transporter [Paenibacillus bovis]
MSAMNPTHDNSPAADKQFNLFRLTWPIFLEVFLFMLMGIVDTLMLSDVSDNAVAAVGTSNQVISIAILILEVIGNGAAIVVAQYIGSRKVLEASRITALAITLNLSVGLLLSTTFLLFGGHLMEAMHLQGEILALAESYIAIVGGAIFLQALINTLAAVIRTYGFTKETMFVSVFMNVLHVGLNYLLIFGHWGLPQMGVQGAAISTIVSRLVCVVIFFWLMYRVMEVRIQIADYFRMSKEYILKILKIGVPSAVEQVTYQMCQLVFVFYVTYLGSEAMASRQYANNISTFIYLFSIAIGMGTAIIVGRLVGANRKEEAYHRVWNSVKWAMGATLIMDVIIILMREPLIGMFTSNPEVIRMASQVILLSFLLETGRTCNIVIINSLRASGDAKFPVYMGLISMVCMSLPLGYLFVFKMDLGLAGIWLAIAADEWVRAVIMYFRWKSRAWQKHSLVQHDEPQTPENVPMAAPV